MRVPLRVRLTAWYLVVLCFSLAILGLTIFWGAKRNLSRIVDDDLRARLAATRSFMAEQIPNDPTQDLQDEFQEFSASQPGGELLQIRDSSGNWLFRSASMQKFGPTSQSSDSLKKDSSGNVIETVNSLRLITGTAEVKGRTYIVQIATDTTKYALFLQQLKWLLLISTPLAIGLALAGGYWLSSRALKPVREITEDAKLIGAEALSQRLDEPQTADEMQFLAETLNAMLARIETSVRRIAQFTEDASHELRTPVSIIRTTAELALRQSRDERANRAAFQDILDEARRTSNLIDDLLTLARADSDGQPLLLASTNISEVVETAHAKASLLAGERKIPVSLSIDNESIWIEADREALGRMFLTLFDNAVKYTPAGGDVAAVLKVANGAPVFEIRDAGIGIPGHAIPHIFDRFFQVDKSRSRSQGGFGLGLSIAKCIADAHGAKINVHSVEGQGTVFSVRFPSPIQRNGKS